MSKTKASRGILTITSASVLIGLAGIGSASAEPSLSIHIGPQSPPPIREETRWESPHSTAVWIPGHHEWNDQHYIWVSGYYTYPPLGNSRWVEPSYPHQKDGYYYRPGYWAK